MATVIYSGIISFVVAVAVSLLIGPLRVRWEEAARRDAQVRQGIRERLADLMLALEREEVGRVRGPDAEGKFTYVQFYNQVRPIARALLNPDLSQKIRKRLRERFLRLVGPERLKYLALLPAEYGEIAPFGELRDVPAFPDPALSPLIFSQTQKYPLSATLIDEMLDEKRQPQGDRREPVRKVIALLGECLRIAGLRQFP